MKLASWNVNGIRACVSKGFHDWVVTNENGVAKHVICLQETKAQPDQIEQVIGDLKKYDHYYASAQRKGYSGVATLIKKSTPHGETEIGLGIEKFDIEGRTLISEFKNYFVINCYFPNGQRDHGRVPYKLEYSREVVKKALQLQKDFKKEIIICGDYNTAHTEIDLANPKTNQKTTGFLPIERQWMDEFIEQGFTDCFREKHPQQLGAYTWWTYRGDCRERNIGWRIDYFFTSFGLSKKIKKAFIKPEVMGSDHCPIYLEV